MANVEELQEKLAEDTDEETDLGANEPVDLEELPDEEERPSFAATMARRSAAVAERAGGAARGLLAGLGTKIEGPGPLNDDLSDLFEGPDMDRDNDVYIEDLVTVDEEDVFGDGGEDMSDLLEVPDDVLDVPEGVVGDVSDVTRLCVDRPCPTPGSRQVWRRPPRSAPPPGGMITGLQ